MMIKHKLIIFLIKTLMITVAKTRKIQTLAVFYVAVALVVSSQLIRCQTARPRAGGDVRGHRHRKCASVAIDAWIAEA